MTSSISSISSSSFLNNATRVATRNDLQKTTLSGHAFVFANTKLAPLQHPINLCAQFQESVALLRAWKCRAYFFLEALKTLEGRLHFVLSPHHVEYYRGVFFPSLLSCQDLLHHDSHFIG